MLFANKLQTAIAASDILPRRTLESLTIVEIVYLSQGCLRVLYIPDLTLIKISSKPWLYFLCRWKFDKQRYSTIRWCISWSVRHS